MPCEVNLAQVVEHMKHEHNTEEQAPIHIGVQTNPQRYFYLFYIYNVMPHRMRGATF